MRERSEVLDEAWSEFVMTVAQIADTDITSTFSNIQERAFAKVVGRLLDKREALAAETRVTEAAKRVIDADTDVLQAVAIVMLREAFAAEAQGESNV
jgi:hypothetical protein